MATITNSYCLSSVTAIKIKVRSFRRLQSPLTLLMLRGLCLLLFCPPFPRQFLAGSAPRADEPFLSVSRGACARSCGCARSPSGTAPDGSGAGVWGAWGDDILGGLFWSMSCFGTPSPPWLPTLCCTGSALNSLSCK